MAIRYGEIPLSLAETPGEVPEVHCPQCNGRTCPVCDDRGTFDLPPEPGAFCADVWPLLAIADMWRKGCMPFPGALLDQPSALTKAVQFIWDDEDHVRADRLGPAMAMII